MEKSLEGC